jgi:hypothetical protein
LNRISQGNAAEYEEPMVSAILSKEAQFDNDLLSKYCCELDKATQPIVSGEFEWKILPGLKANSLRGDITARQYESIWIMAWNVTCRILEAVQPNAKNIGANPTFFWEHQPIPLLYDRYLIRHFNISKGGLIEAAALYLRSPEIRTNRLDWIFLDSFIFEAIIAHAHYLLHEIEGIGTRWAVSRAHGDDVRYLWFRMQSWLADVVLNYVAWPGAAYYLVMHDHLLWALTTAGLWGIFQVFRIALVLERRRTRRTIMKMLKHLQDLYRLLGEKIISPRKLKEELDRAAADDVVIAGAVFAIVDRIVGRDATFFNPTEK